MGQKVSLNGLEESISLGFSSFEFVLVGLSISFCFVFDSELPSRPSIGTSNQFGVECDLLRRVWQCSTPNHAVAVSQVRLINAFYFVQHKLGFSILKESDLLDGSGATSPVAPATLYKALVTDADNVIPKAVEAFRSVENLEGNGGPGTIKKITFVEDGESKFVLHKIESVDEANLGYSYSVVGGVGLPDTVEKITFECKLAAGANGGSAGKLTVKYQTKGDAQPNPDDLKIGKVKSDALFKAVEAYLLANPHYN